MHADLSESSRAITGAFESPPFVRVGRSWWRAGLGRLKHVTHGLSARTMLHALWGVSCSRRFGDDEALRSGAGAMISEAPSGAVQPVVDLLHAVDIAVADVHGEFAGHQRRLQRLGVGRGGPEGGQQEGRARLRGPAYPSEQVLVLLGRPVMDEVGQQEHVVAGG